MSKGRRTRDEILRTALGRASQFGLEGLSIGSLARDVGMSKSGLFAHFGSKEDLQRSVLVVAAELFAAEVVSSAIQRPRGEPRVRGIFESWLSWADSPSIPGGCLFASSAMEFDDRPGPVRELVVELVLQWRATMARAARIAMEEGHFRSDLDPEQFAFEMHALMMGYHLEARLFRGPEAQARACRAFEALLRASR